MQVTTVVSTVWAATIQLDDGTRVGVRQQLEPAAEWTFWTQTGTPEQYAVSTVDPVLTDDYRIAWGDDVVSIPYPPRFSTKPTKEGSLTLNGATTQGPALWRPATSGAGLLPTVWLKVGDLVLFGVKLQRQLTPTPQTVLWVHDMVTAPDDGSPLQRTAVTMQASLDVGCGCVQRGWQTWTRR